MIDVVYHGSPPPEPAPPTPPDSSEPPSDACALITDAELVEILGVALARHEVFDDGTFQTCVKGTARQPLDGIGDAAEYIDGAGMVLVAFGTNVLLVEVVRAGAPAPLDVVIQVAELVLARLR